MYYEKNFRRLLFIIFLLFAISYATTAQCLDVYGRSADCPTEDDSLVVYNNALKVYEFYEKNPDYVKIKTQRLRTRQDVIDCFYQLQDAVDSFQMRWQLRERVLNGEDIPSVLLPRNGKNLPISDYYQYIDAYRFYQRELESGILNMSSPIPIYDIRISPLIINAYEDRYSNGESNGDYVNVALYIPVTIKPYRLLTDSEKVDREKILKGIVPNRIKVTAKKEKPLKKATIDTTLLESAKYDYVPPVIQKEESRFTVPPLAGIPMYYLDAYGGGWLMGYMIGTKFRKFLPTDEFYWALPKKIKDFLNDDAAVEKYIRLKLGGYYTGFYK